MKKVLFICVENAGRSQAEARSYGVDASSAGTLEARNIRAQIENQVIELLKVK